MIKSWFQKRPNFIVFYIVHNHSVLSVVTSLMAVARLYSHCMPVATRSGSICSWMVRFWSLLYISNSLGRLPSVKVFCVASSKTLSRAAATGMPLSC